MVQEGTLPRERRYLSELLSEVRFYRLRGLEEAILARFEHCGDYSTWMVIIVFHKGLRQPSMSDTPFSMQVFVWTYLQGNLAILHSTDF